MKIKTFWGHLTLLKSQSKLSEKGKNDVVNIRLNPSLKIKRIDSALTAVLPKSASNFKLLLFYHSGRTKALNWKVKSWAIYFPDTNGHRPPPPQLHPTPFPSLFKVVLISFRCHLEFWWPFSPLAMRDDGEEINYNCWHIVGTLACSSFSFHSQRSVLSTKLHYLQTISDVKTSVTLLKHS